MGFFTNRYPYIDFHELNLDWVLEKIKNHEDKITTIETWKTNTVDPFIASITAWKGTIDTWKTGIDSWKGTIDTWKTGIDSWKTSISGTVAGHTSDISALQTGKQDKLIAGSNIQIAADGKTISATDTTYTAGTGISITPENVISASGGAVADAFVVTITNSTVDKTFAEIKAAINSQKCVYAVHSNAIGIWQLSDNATSYVQFSKAEAIDSDTVRVRYYRINSDESTELTFTLANSFDRATVTGTIDTWTAGNVYSGGVVVPYPTGYTKDNCMVASFLWSIDTDNIWYNGTVDGRANALGSLVISHEFGVGLGASNIAVAALNEVNTETVTFKIVLAKL